MTQGCMVQPISHIQVEFYPFGIKIRFSSEVNDDKPTHSKNSSVGAGPLCFEFSNLYVIFTDVQLGS